MILAQKIHIDQLNELQDPDTKPHNYSHQVLEQRELLQQTTLGKLDICSRSMRFDPLSFTIHKIQLQKAENCNKRPEILKFLEEKLGTMCQDTGVGKHFLAMTP